MNEQNPNKSAADILIIDDKPENLRLLSRILKERGYTVRMLRKGGMAPESVKKYPPDIILLDIRMPDMDGYEVCGQLKADEQTRDIPVIFISALDEAVDKIKGFNMGGADFIVKPFQEEEVLARVQNHLSLRAAQKRLDERNEQLRRAEEILRKDEKRLNILFKLSQMNISKRELVAMALEEAVGLTFSEVGYLHFINPDQETIDLFSWSKRTLENCTAVKDAHYPLEAAGIWADCVRERQPVIHNDYEGVSNKKGLPEGHFPIRRHMSVPVFDGGRIVAIAGVGNKEQPYDEEDVRQLTLFIQSIWEIFQRKKSEERLRKQIEFLKTLHDVPPGLLDQLEID